MVSEAVAITAKVNFEAFDVPDRVCVIPDEHDEKSEGHCLMDLNFVDSCVFDQLAMRWLNALYAQRSEESPFTLNRDKAK